MKTLRQRLTGEDSIQLLIRLGLLALLIFWTSYLVRPFLTIIVWALVLAVALNPGFALLAKLLGGRPKLAAAIFTAINLAIFLGPAAWLGIGAVESVRHFAAELASGDLTVPVPPQSLKSWSLIGTPLYELWDQASTNLRSSLHQIAPYLKPLAGKLLGLAGDAGVGAIKFLLSIVVAGVIFPYGSQFVAAGRGLLMRIVPEQSEHFLDLAGATIRAVSQGVIGIAVIQALLAGIGFKLAGIHIAGLLALLVLLLSIVQIGAALVMLPVIVWIWTEKDLTTASLLTLFFGIVSILDNVLKPLVMGRGLTTPTLVILIGVIGGTLGHGIVGLFIGPVILSVAWELTVAWIRTDRPAAQSVVER
ncbi:AI-2E family transporter [Bradyrhizobium oligotrophicum S58]